MTYTYAILRVSKATFDEIVAKLREAEAGYEHAFHEGGCVLDMHGIALQQEEGGPR